MERVFPNAKNHHDVEVCVDTTPLQLALTFAAPIPLAPFGIVLAFTKSTKSKKLFL